MPPRFDPSKYLDSEGRCKQCKLEIRNNKSDKQLRRWLNESDEGRHHRDLDCTAVRVAVHSPVNQLRISKRAKRYRSNSKDVIEEDGSVSLDTRRSSDAQDPPLIGIPLSAVGSLPAEADMDTELPGSTISNERSPMSDDLTSKEEQEEEGEMDAEDDIDENDNTDSHPLDNHLDWVPYQNEGLEERGGVLNDDIYEYIGEEQPADHSDDKLGTIGYYRSRLKKNIYQGAEVDLLEWICTWVEKRMHLSLHSIDEIYRFAVKSLPREGNICPNTWKTCEAVLGVENFHKHVYHFCPCGEFRFPQCTPDQFQHHIDETCPRCHLKRFAIDKNGRLEPQQWCFYPGVATAIRTLFANPSFVKALQQPQPDGPHCFYGSKLCKDTEEWFAKHGGGTDIFHRDHVEASPYSIFVDFMQSRKKKTHSTGAVLLRCEAMGPEDIGKAEFAAVLMIIPGPKKPSKSKKYMELIATSFRQWSLGCSGLTIEHAVIEKEIDGVKRLTVLPPFLHRPILMFVDADRPAGQFVMGYPQGNQGKLVCCKCKANGMSGRADPVKYGTQGMFYPGYTSPHYADIGLGAGTGFQIGINDDERMLTEEEYEERLQMVESGSADPNEVGVESRCPLLQQLPYLKPAHLWRIPISHCLMLGLVKQFWREVLRWEKGGKQKGWDQSVKKIALPNSELNVLKKAFAVSKQENPFIVTCDFNRPFSGIDNIGLWTVEDWVRWTEVYSVFIRRETIGVELNDLAARLWHHLRSGVLYYIHGVDESEYEEVRRSSARHHMLEYARLLETEHLFKFLTSNLHTIICWAPLQEQAIGLIARNNELWGERGLRQLKNVVDGKSVPNVDKAYCTFEMRKIAIVETKASIKIREIEATNEEERQNRTRTRSGFSRGHIHVTADVTSPPRQLDDVTGSNGLLGSGTHIRQGTDDEDKHKVIMEGLKRLIEDGQCEDEGWTAEDIADIGDVEVYIHDRAFIHQTQTIHSTKYAKIISRESFHVQVQYPADSGATSNGRAEVMVKWVADVQYYARIMKRGKNTLRLAICHFYKQEAPLIIGNGSLGSSNVNGEDREEILVATKRAGNAHKWNDEFYPVLLENIDTKLSVFKRKASNGDHKLYFKTYNFNSQV